ncbi:MAG: cysteine hydrolase [Deltaproteobacteria bacterium]|nr:cysteine hydrolase [Candidatus Anaeroferrophillus wilburensis]MBN2887976.1 cysteine hydrolase [Deltaproteobacteria bacterium]
MKSAGKEQAALIIIDMVKDYFAADKNYPITPLARAIIPPINDLIRQFRAKELPIIFSTDAFQTDDFIFNSRMHPHAIAGSEGAEVIDDLDREAGDLWLPKPRFSAFFDTGLADILHHQGVTLCAVAGIATNFCVLTTIMDALCHDFKAVMLEDCSAAFSNEIHEKTLTIFRKNPLHPLFRVMSSADLVQEL